MRRWIMGLAAGAWLALGATAACSSSSSGGGSAKDAGGSGDGGGTHDSSVPGDSGGGSDTGGGTDAGGSHDGGGPTDATTGSDADAGTPPGDAAADGALYTITATVTLPGSPRQLAYDTTTDWLYVMLDTGSSQGQIVAVDATANTVKWTLTNDDAGPGNFGFNVIAVDSTANVVYAGADTWIYAYDGTSGALKAAIDVSGVTTSHYVYGLAVDAAAQKLYALIGYATGPQTVVVIDTSTATPTVGPTVALSDLLQDYDPKVNGLALDTQNHLLFACGSSTAAGNPPAADAIDTTTNTEKGAPQVFAGASLGCQAGPGYAAMVTGTSGATSAQVHMLEPASVNLPQNFTPFAFSTFTSLLTDNNTVVLFGIDDTTGNPSTVEYGFCGETLVRTGAQQPAEYPVWEIAPGHRFANAQDMWLTQAPAVDGGEPGSFVYKLHIDEVYLPPSPDGGCDGG